MREHFHVPDNYFLSHSAGCLPKIAPGQFGEAYFTPWQNKGGNAWDDWMGVLERFSSGLGLLVGAPPEHLCPQVNVSSALTKILYSLPERPERKTIVLSSQDFPTVGFVLKQAERAGFTLRFLDGDASDIDVWARALDETVALALITHAFSNTSQIAPVQDICALARARGVVSVVDIAQSVGILPINLGQWQPDFAIGSGLKFLCFGPGAGFLYASAQMLETCQPVDVGWFSHQDPFEMDIHNFRYAETALRFFGGTPSPAPFVLANAALSLWQDIGLDKVQARAEALLSELLEHVPDEILISPRGKVQRGATLVTDPPRRGSVKQMLADKHILFDERKQGLRFSIHGYTSEAEIEQLSAVLAAV